MEKVLLYGRTNVGKSTLFNKLTGHNKAIVEEEPGVTRDLNKSVVEWCGNKFVLIDSGGMDFYEKDYFSKSIIELNTSILDEVSLVLFIVDYKSGITPFDHELGIYLRKYNNKVVVVVNKNDNIDTDNENEFYALGFDNVISVSAIHGKNSGDLLDIIVENLENTKNINIEENRRIIIVGKPNVGKSTLFNSLAGSQRTMVTPIAGTTRDFIEEEIVLGESTYTFIDTAGLRRKRSIYEKVEKHSVYRTVKAIEKADLCLFVIDSEDEISFQETKIAGLIKEAGKAVIIIFNKWDEVTNKDARLKQLQQIVKEKLYFIDYAPIVSISAKTGLRVHKIQESIEKVFDIYYRQIPDRILNDNILPELKIKFPEIKFIKQVKTAPPGFLVFSSKKLHFSRKRFIENVLRENIDFSGTPIKMIYREPEK
ncbi:MAG: ribosome biogenesis GTPase Der [Candidatus Muirbacterium halophilum]|nr:ribosome biogenesis GTPase Der [Candidatus Muirbacterium halophilum]